jgi:hypothetical protein
MLLPRMRKPSAYLQDGMIFLRLSQAQQAVAVPLPGEVASRQAATVVAERSRCTRIIWLLQVQLGIRTLHLRR